MLSEYINDKIIIGDNIKKEIKKKTTKKIIKKTKVEEKQKEPAAEVSLGSLIVCINDFNSEIFLEKY